MAPARPSPQGGARLPQLLLPPPQPLSCTPHPDPWSHLLLVSSCGDSSSSLQPSLGNEVTLNYATSGSVGCALPTAWLGVPVSPTPREGAVQGYYLNLPTIAPPAAEGQSPVLSFPPAIGERRGPLVSLAQKPPMVTSAPGPLFRKSPCH